MSDLDLALDLDLSGGPTDQRFLARSARGTSPAPVAAVKPALPVAIPASLAPAPAAAKPAPAAPAFATPDAPAWWPRRKWRFEDGRVETYGPIVGPISPLNHAIASLVYTMSEGATVMACDREAALLAAAREAERMAEQTAQTARDAASAVAAAMESSALDAAIDEATRNEGTPVALNGTQWCSCPLGSRPAPVMQDGRRWCPSCRKVWSPFRNGGGRAIPSAGIATSPEPARVPSALTESAVRVQIATRQEIVVGARSEGSHVMLGWDGLGELTTANFRAALAAAGCSLTWAPESKSARAIAGRAVMSLATVGTVPRAETRRQTVDRRGQRTPGNPSGRERDYDARWTVGIVDHSGDVGDSFGQTALTVTLRGETLSCDGDAALAARVKAEYSRALALEIHPAGDVTDWLRETLVRRFHAVRMGGVYFVPARHAERAEALCTALAKGTDTSPRWGVNWILPAIPVSTTEQLRAGLANGLAAEAATVLDDLAARRREARAQGRSDVGERAATSLLRRLRDVSDRAKGYRDILGDEQSAAVYAAVNTALAEINPLVDDTSQRGAMLELD